MKPDWKTTPAHERIEIILAGVRANKTSRMLAEQFENCTTQALRNWCSRNRIKLLNHTEATGVAIKKPTRTASKLVRRLFEIMDESGQSYGEYSGRIGVHAVTLSNWKRQGASPRLYDFECAAEVLGYRLEMVPIQEEAKC